MVTVNFSNCTLNLTEGIKEYFGGCDNIECDDEYDEFCMDGFPSSKLHSEVIESENDTIGIDKVKLHKCICDRLNDIYRRKNHDYGNSFAKCRKESSSYTTGKLFDKYSRLKKLSENGDIQVADEGIIDTLMDLANYAIMEVLEREIEQNY